MPLTVLSVAFPFAAVRPEVAGGAEQILLALDRAIVAAGHRSVVIASADSKVSGELIGTPVWTSHLECAREPAALRHRQSIETAIARHAPDVLHYHGFDFHLYAPPTATPSMATLHLPPDHYPPDILAAGRIHLYCVSESQKKRCSEAANIAGVIPNGVDTAFYRPLSDAPDSYAVALGRICPEKGFHLALDAAKLAGIPLLLAGEVFAYEAHREYFAREIEPRLDSQRRFIGRIGPQKKRDLLTRARCLIAPSLIAETSSLTAMEALACGVPVIASDAGALPEIVEHGRTGFIATTPEEIASAIALIGSISRAECRRTAEERFDSTQMISRYFAAWHSMAAVCSS